MRDDALQALSRSDPGEPIAETGVNRSRLHAAGATTEVPLAARTRPIEVQTVDQGPRGRRRAGTVPCVPRSDPPDLPDEGPCIAGYVCQRKLGEGTYGKVWLAIDERTGVQVAIKVFDHRTDQQWQLLQAEVRQLARLHGDPGIVELHAVGVDSDLPYYVMRFAEQGSLTQRLARGPLPVEQALAIFRQVAESLAYVHVKGIRHCDLKPGNILLDSRGRALLADFGQAHLTSDLTPALGTYFYMAPEQADLEQTIPDTRWDVYGLGALFFTMVTGHPPRETTAIHETLADTPELSVRLARYRDWVRTAPPPTEHHHVPGMDRRLATILDRCLAVDPNRRYHDAAAVLDALDRREQSRRRRPLYMLGFFMPLLLLLSTGINAAVLGSEAAAREEPGWLNYLGLINLAAFTGVAALTTGLWAWFLWSLRREEQFTR